MLTIEQLTTLKLDIQSKPAFWSNGTQMLSNEQIADYYNTNASPDFMVWSETADVQSIFNAIDWAKMTPPAPSAADATGIYRDRALTCQGKQFNLQTMLQGRETINASKINIRAGLQDALTGIPSKADGTNQSAGWATVQTTLQKKATNIEKLFSTGTGTAVSPATITSGLSNHLVSPDEVVTALNS